MHHRHQPQIPASTRCIANRFSSTLASCSSIWSRVHVFLIIVVWNPNQSDDCFIVAGQVSILLLTFFATFRNKMQPFQPDCCVMRVLLVTAGRWTGGRLGGHSLPHRLGSRTVAESCANTSSGLAVSRETHCVTVEESTKLGPCWTVKFFVYTLYSECVAPNIVP